MSGQESVLLTTISHKRAKQLLKQIMTLGCFHSNENSTTSSSWMAQLQIPPNSDLETLQKL
jgi:hypothetical protein